MEKERIDTSCGERVNGPRHVVNGIHVEISSDGNVRKSGIERLRQRLWEISRSVTFQLSPWSSAKWRRFVISWVSGNSGYAPGCVLSRTCRIDYPWNVWIGAGTIVGERVWIQAQDKIMIGSCVCIDDEVRIIAGSHDITSRKFDLKTEPIVVGDKAWIATGAIVLQGVMIGEGAIVSAGSVVTKNVDPWTIVAGNPAQVVGCRQITEEGDNV